MTVLPPLRASSRPLMTRSALDRVCIRCGIDWIDSRSTFIDRAPCRDCRAILEHEGEDIVELYIRPHLRAARRESRERRIAQAPRLAEQNARRREEAA